MSRRGQIEECPECFLMLNRRSLTFMNLENHPFSGEEKDFIVGEIILIDDNKLDQLLICSDFPKHKGRKSTGVSKIAERYNIPLTTIKNWLKKSKSSGKCLSGSVGRPYILDEISIREVVEMHVAAEIPTGKGIHPLTTNQSNQLFLEQKIATYNRKFVDSNKRKRVNVINTTIDNRTIKRIKKSTKGLHDRVPQGLTMARYQNLFDIRLCYIHSCFICRLCEYLAATSKWNCDCTTFLCLCSGTGTEVVVWRPKGHYQQVCNLTL